MLFLAPEHVAEPFECILFESAFSDERLRELEGFFELPLEWEHHHGGFYECFIAHGTDQLSGAWRAEVAKRMAALLGEDLHEDLRLTLQRMEPGQQARVHTDRPLLGFESARLIVQLQPDWQPGDGGEFHAHPDAGGKEVRWSRPPRRNQALAFVMGDRSFHSVTPVKRQRRTLVLHFWHRFNRPEVARRLQQLFASCRFDQLPPSLDPIATEAESHYDEDATYQASSVAWLLTRWEQPEDVVTAGYLAQLETPPPWTTDETHPLRGRELALAMARWLAWQLSEEVDVSAWRALAPRLPESKDLEPGPVRDWLQLLTTATTSPARLPRRP